MHQIIRFVFFLFFASLTHAAQQDRSGQTTIPGTEIPSFEVPGIPTQGEDFLRESLTVIPDDLDEFKVGGGSIIFPPSGGYKFDLHSKMGVSIPPVIGCNGLNISGALTTTLSSVKEGVLGYYTSIQSSITSILTSMPLFALAQVSPTAYEVLTQGIEGTIEEFVGVDFPSCQDLKAEIDAKNIDQEKSFFENTFDTWAKKVKVTRADAFSSAESGGQKASDPKNLVDNVQNAANQAVKKGEPCPDKPCTQCGGVGTEKLTSEQLYKRGLDEIARVQEDSGSLAQFFGNEPGKAVTDQQKEEFSKTLSKILGNQEISTTEGADGTPVPQKEGTPAAGSGPLYQEIQAQAAKAFAEVIEDINRVSPPRSATPADVAKIRAAAAGASVPTTVLDLLAKGVRQEDAALLRMQGWLMSALTYRKMLMGLMISKQMVTVLESDQVVVDQPLQQSLLGQITRAFSAMWDRDEIALIREFMEADKNVAQAIRSISDLQEVRDRAYPIQPGA